MIIKLWLSVISVVLLAKGGALAKIICYTYGQEYANAIAWPCNDHSDCTVAVSTSRCSNIGYCQCPAGFVFSSDFTKCIRESAFGEPCEESVQCSHMLTGSACENGICTCTGGSRYVRSRCRRLTDLHERCSEDIECNFGYDRESVVCGQDGQCQCADNYYERAKNVCRRIASAGEHCLVNEDCADPGLTCSTQTWTCQPISRSVSVQTDSASASISYENEKVTQSSSANSRLNKSASLLSQKLSTLNSPLEEDDIQFGTDCDITEERQTCPGLPYSVCRQGLCVCQDGYFASNGLCKAELGETADAAELCGAGELRDGKCVCARNQFYGDSMRVCMKTALGIGTSCTVQSQCSPYNAICPVLSPKRCQCHASATYNPDTQLCEPKQGLGEFCETNQHCSLANTHCTPQQTCACHSNYIEKDGQCLPGKDSACTTTAECGFPNAECQMLQCQCKEKFVYVKESCLPIAESKDEACQEKEQCTPLLGPLGNCIDSKCTCAEHLHHKDGKCHERVKLTERCQRSSQCFVEQNTDRVECRNEVCQCKFEYSTDLAAQSCVKPGEGKSASNRPSPLKVITLLLFASAALITGTAITDALWYR